jgi:hypothetical protein
MKIPIEQIQIQNLSDRRYELFGMEFPDWDLDKEAELHPPEIQKEIDDLADQILDAIKRWRNALPFEFIFEELTNLGWAPCLLYDDNGNFAISDDGMQSISEEVDDQELFYFIKKDRWKETIREALNYYLDHEEEEKEEDED